MPQFPPGMPAVFLLKSGSIDWDEHGRILDARSSVTMIINGRHKIIVDSGLMGEEEPLCKALAELGVKPGQCSPLIVRQSIALMWMSAVLFLGAGMWIRHLLLS